MASKQTGERRSLCCGGGDLGEGKRQMVKIKMGKIGALT